MAAEVGELERWWSENTVAIVTGGNRGLGFGIVCELARSGLTVVLTSRDAEKGLAAVEAALQVEPKASGCIHFHQVDVTDKQSVAELTGLLRSKFGGIDILVFDGDECIKRQVERAVRNLDMNVVDSLSAKYLEDLRSGRLKDQKTAKFYQYRLWIVDTGMTREYYDKFDQLAPQRYANTGIKLLSVDQGGKAPVWLALMPDKNHPQGKFFIATEESSF